MIIGEICFAKGGKIVVSTVKQIEVNEIILPEGIEEINELAFYAQSFKSIILPSTLKEIGDHAFMNSGNLRKVVFNSNVKFSANIFDNCPKLENITFPSEVNVYNLDKDFYDRYHSIIYQIKPQTIDELINNNKSFRQINELYKNIEDLNKD